MVILTQSIAEGSGMKDLCNDARGSAQGWCSSPTRTTFLPPLLHPHPFQTRSQIDGRAQDRVPEITESVQAPTHRLKGERSRRLIDSADPALAGKTRSICRPAHSFVPMASEAVLLRRHEAGG